MIQWLRDPTNLTAISTAVIAAFTCALFIATYRQLRHLQREFNATHRPKMVVHAIVLPDSDDGKVQAVLVCFNKGKTIARNVTVYGDILRTNSLPVDSRRSQVWGPRDIGRGIKMRAQ